MRGPNQTAHIPGPRRKPTPPIVPEVQVPKAEETTFEGINEGAATAEPELISVKVVSEKGHEAPQPGGWQKPMTFGSVDG